MKTSQMTTPEIAYIHNSAHFCESQERQVICLHLLASIDFTSTSPLNITPDSLFRNRQARNRTHSECHTTESPF